jgi:hypothetical protein
MKEGLKSYDRIVKSIRISIKFQSVNGLCRISFSSFLFLSRGVFSLLVDIGLRDPANNAILRTNREAHALVRSHTGAFPVQFPKLQNAPFI